VEQEPPLPASDVCALIVSGQQTSLSPGFVGVQPASTAVEVCPGSQSSLRGFPDWPAQSVSVSAPGFCVHGTVVGPPDDAATPNTVVGQQTSLSPAPVSEQPARIAPSVSELDLQSSFRGLPD
jgi:hypothetical protein